MRYTSHNNDAQGRDYSQYTEYEFNGYKENGLLSLLVKVALIVILVVIVLFATGTVHAQELDYSGDYASTYIMYRPNINAHDSRPNACRTWNIGGYDATDGVSCGTDAQNKHREPISIATVNIVQNDNIPVTIAPVAVQYGSSDNSPSPVQNDGKKHCNQGKGNGSEGCDPGNSNHNQVSNDEPVSNQRGKGKNK